MASLTAPLAVRTRGRFVGFVALAPALLLLAHLLPATGAGLAIRLAAAAACVLLVPGALLLRAIGWPASPGIAVAGSFALSLAIDAFGLALVFAAGGSILLMGIVIASVSVVVAVPAALRNGVRPVEGRNARAFTAVFASGVLFSVVVWWAAGPVNGDGFFHLARARKLAELDVLNGLSSVDEFKDGGLHPGYAFPLWHAVDALVARLAGVDVADVVVYLPAILVPLALLLAYAAGNAVFRSPYGGRRARGRADGELRARPTGRGTSPAPASSRRSHSRRRPATCSSSLRSLRSPSRSSGTGEASCFSASVRRAWA